MPAAPTHTAIPGRTGLRSHAPDTPALSQSAPKRIGWIDAARGLGIILVVLGHIMTDPIGKLDLAYAIFTFHMPLFVFLSAMVLKTQDWKAVASTRWRALIIPYVITLALIGLTIALWSLHDRSASTIKSVARLLLGGGFLFNALGPFWYVPTFFVSIITYAALRDGLGGERSRPFTSGMIAMLGIAYAISFARIGFPVPYCLHAVPAMVVFIWIGRLVPWPKLLNYRWGLASLVVVTICVLLDEQSSTHNFAFDMKGGRLGLPILGIVLAVAGSHLAFLVSTVLCKAQTISRVLTFCGRNTLPILFLHQSVNFGAQALNFHCQPAIAAAAIAIPCLLAYTLAKGLPRYAWLFGVPAPQ